MGSTSKKKNAPKAVSIWADNKTRQMFKRVSRRSGKALSEIVRVLVANYDKKGKATGLPRLSAPKKAKKPAATVEPALLA